MRNKISLSELAESLGIKWLGDNIEIDGLGFCGGETNYRALLSFVLNENYVEEVRDNNAIVCLVLPEKLLDCYSEEKLGRAISYIISDRPKRLFYTIHEHLCKTGNFYEVFDFEPVIGEACEIAESAVIEKGVVIGNNVTIGPNTVVRPGSIIDDNTYIGCNTTIGSEGFQSLIEGDSLPMHITHVGRCHICEDVYIGDNTCICNSLFEGETYIGRGAQIDNLVHVAHNLYIGAGAIVTAHVILCGSSRIEEDAWLGPNSSVLNGVVVGKGAKVGLASVVTRNVLPDTVVYGSPAKVHEKK